MLPAMILDPPQEIGSKMPDSSEFSEPTLYNHPILQTKKRRSIHPHGPSWPSLARWKPLRPGKVRKRKSRTSWSSGRGSTPMSGKKSLISCTAAWPKDREEGDPSLQSVKRGCPGLLAWLGYTFASWERERYIYICTCLSVCACTCSISLWNSTTSRMKEASIILNFWQKKRVPPGQGGLTVLSCFVEYTYLSGWLYYDAPIFQHLPAFISYQIYPLLVFWVPKF